MKIVRPLVAALAFTSLSHAATVTISSGFGSGVTDSNGSIANGEGSLRIGYFSSLADSSLAGTSASGLLADFNTFASVTSTFGSSGLAGVFSISADAGLISSGNAFVGENIYLLAFNEDQSETLIVKYSETFVADPSAPTPPSSQTLGLVQAGQTFIVGSQNGNLDAPLSSVPAYQMGAVVPEPSIALLGALGILGLVRRRR